MRVMLKVFALLLIGVILSAHPASVRAQEGAPNGGSDTGNQAGTEIQTGKVSGRVINQNDPAMALQGLEVMLHVLDSEFNSLGMLHGITEDDGSYVITDVPFQVGLGYAAAVVFEDTVYYSDVATAQEGVYEAEITVPVYESTTDVARIRVAQMHVLFNFAADGIEVQEIFALSNSGDRTVKNGVVVPVLDGLKATVQFPLPAEAEYVSFQPQAEERFYKFSGGFADTAPLTPGEAVSQFLVGYLTPYTSPPRYQLKTVFPVDQVTFVVPQASGLILEGAGLGVPQQVTGQNGKVYDMYSIANLSAGVTIDLVLAGQLKLDDNQPVAAGNPASQPGQTVLFWVVGLLGAAMVGGGGWWWMRSSRSLDESEPAATEAEGADRVDGTTDFETVLQEIARLDQAHEAGEMDENEYAVQRSALKTRARSMISENEEK